MKLGRFIQSLLIMVAVVGIFAAMARNSYGFELVGISCFGLTLLYTIQFLWKIIDEFGSLGMKVGAELLELLLLALLTSLLGTRSFYIYFNFTEPLFYTVVILQMILYSYLGYSLVNKKIDGNMKLGRNLVFFYLSLIFFFIALLLNSNASLSTYSGAAALLISTPVLLSILRREKFDVGNKVLTFVQFGSKSGNKAGLLFLFFISSSIFAGLTAVDILPSIQNVNQPPDYIELVGRAERGEEQKVDGKFSHERYKTAMGKFLERHQPSEK